MSGFFPTLFNFSRIGVIIILSNIIYNFEDLRTLLIDKTKVGSYYLIFDDLYFEEIEKDTVICRETYNVAKKVIKSSNVIKYIIFNVKENYTTKEIYELIQFFRSNTTIIVTIFNPKLKEVFLLFISNKDDNILENNIQKILEIEEI